MRRTALVVAMFALCCSSSATGSSFDQLSSRLKQYDDGDSVAPQSQPALPPKRSAVVSQKSAPRSDAQQTQVPEEIVPGSRDRAYRDEWAQDQPWHEPYYDDCCDWGCGDCCDFGGCGCGSPFWGNAEYLHWWVRGGNAPPLVTTSPDNTAQASAGVLPTATVLFGGERLNEAGRSGGRFTAGYWFDPCRTLALESSTLFLGAVDEVFNATSGGSPILARPFFNVLTNANDANLVAFPGIVLGNINVSSTSRVAGTELNLRHRAYVGCARRVDYLVGWRFFQLTDGLRIATDTTSIDSQSQIPVGTNFVIHDTFTTRNNFNGGQIGINAHYGDGCWNLDLLAKVALGGVAQHVGINGTTVVTSPDGTATNNSGGILALVSNMGGYRRSRFAVLPEFGATLRRQLSPCWNINVGYTLLILSNVVRPGDQIDTRLDTNLFPPPIATGTLPRFVFNDSDVWVQGVNFGLECNF